MGQEREQDRPGYRRQKRIEDLIQLIGHQGEETEEEDLYDTFAFHCRAA
jgi:hypothetical protein